MQVRIIKTADNYNIGTVCIVDKDPRDFVEMSPVRKLKPGMFCWKIDNERPFPPVEELIILIDWLPDSDWMKRLSMPPKKAEKEKNYT